MVERKEENAMMESQTSVPANVSLCGRVSHVVLSAKGEEKIV